MRYILWQKCSIYTKAQVEIMGSIPGYCIWCIKVLCQREMHENVLIALPTYVACELIELAVASDTLAQVK